MSAEANPTTAPEPHVPVDELQRYIPGLEEERSEEALVLRRHSFPEQKQPLWCPIDPDVVEVVLVVDGTGHIERKLAGTWERGAFAPGDLVINPGPAGAQAWSGDPHVQLRAYISLDLLRRTAAETSLGPDRPRVVPRFLTEDSVVATLMRAAWTRLGAGPHTEPLYADQVARMLGLRVLKAHTTPEASGLTPQAENGMDERWLQRVKDYVEAHLDADISLEDLAEQAGMSEFHFAHQFKEAEGQPPYRYVVERRMEKAKTLLTDPRNSIAQVAFAVGYSSQSSFTVQFRRHTGTTPGQFRRERT
ncbi:MAG: helix-turn-helix transcriptional regulator [Salinibacter sp.]